MLTDARPKGADLSRAEGQAKLRAQPVFVLLAILVGVQFLIGGASRDDVVSLMVLRPLNVLILALSIFWGWRLAWQHSRPLLIFGLATVGLTLIHLVPLPPALWTALPGRDIVADIFDAAKVPLPWQPISLAQIRTWNALFFLAGPLAALILTAGLGRFANGLVLRALIAIGLISGLIGLLQAIGPVKGPLYFYRITNFGDGVGLFSNRNHQAVFIAAMFPLLAAHFSLWRANADRLMFQKVLTASVALFFVPLILVSGSRIGLILGAFALGLAAWVYSPPQAVGRRDSLALYRRLTRTASIGAAVLGVALLSIVAVRARLLERLFASDPSTEIRVQALPTNLEIAGAFFPIGSGIGSFVEVYRYFEPDALLNERYLNHAHNDFLEAVMTAGLPGLLLIVAALSMGLLGALRLARAGRVAVGSPVRSEIILGRAGIATLFLLALASVTDYPLRVPSLAVVAAISATWAWRGYLACAREPRSTRGHRSPGSFQ
ncbi:MAG: O-antigen ligase family protein [Qipengyuania sp.]|nr:O-antigen ligase family protein [Qipengyuania sp.]